MAMTNFNAISAPQIQAWSSLLRDASSIRGKFASYMVVDKWAGNNLFDLYPSPSSYEMVKLGRKEYGFRPHNKQLGGIAISYKCSHLEARRRFALLLITRRLRG